MKQVVFDIETDGLKPTVIWCVACKQVDTGDVEVFYHSNSFGEYLKKLGDQVELIGHNIIAYDIPALEELWGVDFTGYKITDTLVLSRLTDPSREGGHSLDNWGQKLGFPKGDHDDWTTLTDAMVEYCCQDVRVNELVYKRLLSEAVRFGSGSVSLEHDVQRIIAGQIKAGWRIDQQKVFILLAELKEKKYDLEEQVHQTFIPLPTFVKVVTPKVKKDGSYSVVGLKFLGEQWTTAVAPFSRLDYPEFNLG